MVDFFNSVFTEEPSGELPSLDERNIEIEWQELTLTEEMVKDILKNLKVDKSPGIDKLHPKLLKELAEELAYPLKIVFKQSLHESKIQDEWKQAKISAIFKKGNKSMAGNYRPVSLTSVVCKVLEKLLRDHIISHMEKNDLFTNKQYGFMAGRSTALQLIRVMDEWTEAVDNGNSIDCVYMDFQKAFDTVPHKRLINKLKAYKIGGEAIKWISDFLEGRTQYVEVNGEKSKWTNVTSGIPQGSVLGPLLFVIYINDLPEQVNSTVYLFADDTKISNIIKDDASKECLQQDLNLLQSWSKTWLLKSHPQKCKHMHIGKKIDETTYKLGDHELEKTKVEKDIGVYVDCDLTFDTHISEKVKKANSMFGVIRRNFQYLDEKTFLPLYKSLVRTHLDYACSVWSPYKMKHIEQIESVQRRASKQLPGMAELTYPERLKKLKLPTLAYRRIRGDMIEMYKIMSNKYNKKACNFIQLSEEIGIRGGNRGNSKKVYQQHARTQLRKNSFRLRSANLWNNLPEKIISAETLNCFKNRFDKYMEDQDIVFDNFKANVCLTRCHKVDKISRLSMESVEEVPNLDLR